MKSTSSSPSRLRRRSDRRVRPGETPMVPVARYRKRNESYSGRMTGWGRSTERPCASRASCNELLGAQHANRSTSVLVAYRSKHRHDPARHIQLASAWLYSLHRRPCDRMLRLGNYGGKRDGTTDASGRPLDRPGEVYCLDVLGVGGTAHADLTLVVHTVRTSSLDHCWRILTMEDCRTAPLTRSAWQ